MLALDIAFSHASDLLHATQSPGLRSLPRRLLQHTTPTFDQLELCLLHHAPHILTSCTTSRTIAYAYFQVHGRKEAEELTTHAHVSQEAEEAASRAVELQQYMAADVGHVPICAQTYRPER